LPGLGDGNTLITFQLWVGMNPIIKVFAMSAVATYAVTRNMKWTIMVGIATPVFLFQMI